MTENSVFGESPHRAATHPSSPTSSTTSSAEFEQLLSLPINFSSLTWYFRLCFHKVNQHDIRPLKRWRWVTSWVMASTGKPRVLH
jgi:hypothetical protein